MDSFIFILYSPKNGGGEALYLGSTIQTCLGVVSSLIPIEKFLLTFKNLLLVRIHQAKEIIVKRLSQGRNKVTELEAPKS